MRAQARWAALGMGVLVGAVVAGGALAEGQGKGRGDGSGLKGAPSSAPAAPTSSSDPAEYVGPVRTPGWESRQQKRGKMKVKGAPWMTTRPLFVEQAGKRTRLHPLTAQDAEGRTLTVAEFYGYADVVAVSANTPTGIELEDISQLFFYSAGEADLNLVFIHNKPNPSRPKPPPPTKPEGKLTFELMNLPAGFGMAVADDPSGTCWDTHSPLGTSGLKLEWRWQYTYTDGAALSGFDGRFDVQLQPTFYHGVGAWMARSAGMGNGADVLVTLDMAQPIRLLGLGKPGAAGAAPGDRDRGAKKQP